MFAGSLALLILLRVVSLCEYKDIIFITIITISCLCILMIMNTIMFYREKYIRCTDISKARFILMYVLSIVCFTVTLIKGYSDTVNFNEYVYSSLIVCKRELPTFAYEYYYLIPSDMIKVINSFAILIKEMCTVLHRPNSEQYSIMVSEWITSNQDLIKDIIKFIFFMLLSIYLNLKSKSYLVLKDTTRCDNERSV